MLNFLNMLSIEHDHDLFQFLCVPPQVPELEEPPSKPKSGRKRKSCHGRSNILHGHERPGDCEKRIVHRDVERQRRKEMAGLYGSLRSFLPAEYLQRRSISNDMHGAVNYINRLKGKVDELMNKRNELQKLVNFGKNTSGSCNGSSFSYDHEKTSVEVQSCNAGVQIILKTSSVKGLPLSKILSTINGEGLDVLSCTSTTTNEGKIHVIESEVDEGRSYDQTNLLKRLRDLVHNL